MIAPLLFTPRCLEERLKLAYYRRQPGWALTYPNSRVWSAAAAALLQAHQTDPQLPLDPELFVASQPIRGAVADPWKELTQPEAIDRYRSRVLAIVKQLRRELRGEIRWVRRRLDRGLNLELVLGARNRSLSPLGRYIIAIQELREDLALSFLEEALEQHTGCPLYRLACQGMLPDATYPADLPSPVCSPDGTAVSQFSLN